MIFSKCLYNCIWMTHLANSHELKLYESCLNSDCLKNIVCLMCFDFNIWNIVASSIQCSFKIGIRIVLLTHWNWYIYSSSCNTDLHIKTISFLSANNISMELTAHIFQWIYDNYWVLWDRKVKTMQRLRSSFNIASTTYTQLEKI